MGDVESSTAEDHALAIVSQIDLCLAEALAHTSQVTPESFPTFARYLDRDWIEQALSATGTATLRRRRLPAERVVWLVVGMALLRDRPIANVVDQLDLALPAPSGTRTVAPSAVVKARARVGAAPVEWLYHRSAAEWAMTSAEADRWRGLSLWAVDGTTLRVPDSPENRAHFGGQPAGDRGVSGYPSLRLVTVMAVRSHLLLTAGFGPYAIDERQYAQKMWHEIPDHSLVLLDRLYLQANVLCSLQSGGDDRHWLIRAKTTSKWKVLKRRGRNDHLVELTVSRNARQKDPTLPESFVARAIRYQRKGFQPQTLFTSMTDARRFPAGEIRDLYHQRWEIELGYGEIKTGMLERLETIRSKSPEAVAQEVWGLLLAYNLIRLEMERIADEVGLPPRRISFVAALRYIADEWSWAAISRSPGAIPRHLADMRDKIRIFVLPPRRPERRYPRAVKIKMSNYPRNRPERNRAK
jgi:hypothetical protein